MEYMQIIINIGCTFVLLIGILMTFLGLAGNLLILLTAIAYAFYNQFENIDYAILTILLAAYITGEAIEFIAGILGAKKAKASKRTMVAAFLGTLIGGLWGTAILPLVGSLVGAFIGAFISSVVAEYTKTKDIEQSKVVAMAVVKGQLIGTVVKASIAVAMVTLVIYNLPWR